jgi:hypothetical protein
MTPSIFGVSFACSASVDAPAGSPLGPGGFVSAAKDTLRGRLSDGGSSTLIVVGLVDGISETKVGNGSGNWKK